MPFFEYECAKCGDKFEFLHLGKNEVVKCEKCGAKKVRKLPSSFGFGFKGFGAPSAPANAPSAADGENEAGSGGGCGCSHGACGCG